MPTPGPRVTLSDVAAAAGVCRLTVINAIYGRRNVSPRTAHRVRRAIARLGYQPQPHNRLSLTTQQIGDAVIAYQSGTGIRGVADLIGASYGTARDILRREGVTLRSRGGQAGRRRGARRG